MNTIKFCIRPFLYYNIVTYIWKTGGYHARTPLVCNIVFLGTYLVTVMLEALKVNNSVVWIMYLLSCLIILRFSPIENVNKE